MAYSQYSNKPNPVLKKHDMDSDMKKEIVRQAIQEMEMVDTDQELANQLKKFLETNYPGSWHVIIGRNFGSFVTYEKKRYLYFYLGQKGFLIFKTVTSILFLTYPQLA